MRMAIPLVPIYPEHPNSCNFGNALFFFVPGDTGNPFVAIWQADLVFAIVLAVAGILLLWLGRSRQGISRYLSWVYVAGVIAGVLLAGITFISSTPLACNGAPGGAPLSNTDIQAYNLFETLNTLSTLMLYLTFLFMVAFGAFLITVGMRAAWRRVRDNGPDGTPST